MSGEKNKPTLWGRIGWHPLTPLIFVGTTLAKVLSGRWELGWLSVSALVVLGTWLVGAIVNYFNGGRLLAWMYSGDEDENENTPLISLVLLLAEPRRVTEDALRAAAAKVLGGDAGGGGPLVGPAPAVDGFPGVHGQVVFSETAGPLLVADSCNPYVADLAAAPPLRDLRVRSAIEKHGGWVGVDALGDPEEGDEKKATYAEIGRLLAELAGPDCLAVYCPELGRMNEYHPSLLSTLAGGDPLALFEEPTFEPVVEAREGDARMAAAEEEARRRWPEFVAAFAEREGDAPFLVKLKFTGEGDPEFMWVAVTAATADSVTGTLENEPHHVGGVTKGDTVTAWLDRLNDWLYRDASGDTVGGWTMKVLAEEQNAK